MTDKKPNLEWLDLETIECLEPMRAVIQEELDVRVATGDIVPENATSTEMIAELIADSLIRPFVVRLRRPDQPLLRWVDQIDDSGDKPN